MSIPSGFLVVVQTDNIPDKFESFLSALSGAMIGRKWTLLVWDEKTLDLTKPTLEKGCSASLVVPLNLDRAKLGLYVAGLAAYCTTGWSFTASEVAAADVRKIQGAPVPLAKLLDPFEGPEPVTRHVAESGPVQKTDVEIFIFNYGHLDNAVKTADKFNSIGVKATVLSARHKKDNYTKHLGKPVIGYPSDFYYSHLWNAARTRCTSRVMGIITADATIPDAALLVSRMLSFFNTGGDKAWIYAPDVNFSVWRYRRGDLKHAFNGCYHVPQTDSTCWFTSRACYSKIGHVDDKVNVFGYGIELLGAYLCKKERKMCVRDYGIEIVHPSSKNYSDTVAQEQERRWAYSLGIGDEFFDFKQSALGLVDWRRPKITYATNCMGRLQHLRLTLQCNLALNQASDIEFLLLDYNSQDGLGDWVHNQFKHEISSGRLTYCHTKVPKKYHISHAKNCAHRLSAGEIIVNLDADNFLVPEYDTAVRRAFERPDRVVRVITPDKEMHFSPWGRVAIRREDFIQLGGYSELLTGYGYEDSQLIEAAKTWMGLKEVGLSHSLAFALEHDNSMRVANYDEKNMWHAHNKNVEISAKLVQDGVKVNNQGIPWGCLDVDPYAH